MTKLNQDLSIAQALSLIDSYAFDVGTTRPEELLQSWLNVYHASWIRLATIEALYLGRYKTISIEHILNVWLRLGSPNTHFTHEFERLICRKLPKHLIEVHDFADESATIHSAMDETELFILSTESKPKLAPNYSHQQQPQPLAKNYRNYKQIKTEQKLHSRDEQLKSSEILAQTSPDSLEGKEAKSQKAATLSELKSLLDRPKLESQETKPLKQSPQDSSLTARESGKTANNKASMSLISALGITYQPDWSELSREQTPIHKFIPLPDVSSFFNKLKAFAD